MRTLERLVEAQIDIACVDGACCEGKERLAVRGSREDSACNR